jgi:pyrimidine-specific ribonucleoside hydrolase
VRPVILDVDTGVDDACALLLASRHPGLDLLAVTCVAGNARLPDVVRNTLTVLEACRRPDVPVGVGADRPMCGPAGEPRPAHGRDGMADLGWPAPALRPDPRPAVELLRDITAAAAESRRPGTLVTLAPLTNVAALLDRPFAVDGLGAIMLMGGTLGATAAGEFNVQHDPEAAAATLEAAGRLGIPVTRYPLDVFYAPTVSRAEAARLTAVGRRSPAELAGRLITFQCNRFGADEATIGDAGAVCAVLDPAGLTVEPRQAIQVATGVDGPRYARLWLEAVG